MNHLFSINSALLEIRGAAFSPFTDHDKLQSTLRELLDISMETTKKIDAINSAPSDCGSPMVGVRGKCSCDTFQLMNYGCNCGGV